MSNLNTADDGKEVVIHVAPELDCFRSAPELDLRSTAEKEAVPVQDATLHVDGGRRGTICGVRKPIFFALLVLLILVIAGATIGGAVAGSMAASQHKARAATSSTPQSLPAPSPTTSTSSEPPSSSTFSLLSASSSASSTSSTSSSASSSPTMGTYDCPSINGTDYTTSAGTGSATFRQLCAVDWPIGMTAAAGSATSTVRDLQVVLEYSLQACIEQCAVYTINNKPGCVALVYDANVTRVQDRGFGGNCFLKSAVGASNVMDTSGQEIGAYLIT